MAAPVISPLGRVVADAVRWQFEGQPRITLVAKATFALADGDGSELLDPEPFRASRATGVGDLVPFREHADVLVFGDPAEHPDGVDISIARGAPLVQTRAEVLADRGAGASGSALGQLADDVDWRVFQEARGAQQAPLLHGGDELVVDGIRRKLPAMRGALYVADEGAPAKDGERIEMEADGLLIDLDRRRCSMVFRSVFALEDEDEDLAGRVLHVGVEAEDGSSLAGEALGVGAAAATGVGATGAALAAGGQPGTGGKPGMASQPGAAGQPGMASQPGMAARPGAGAQPGMAAQPGTAAQLGAGQPGMAGQSGMAAQTGAAGQPGTAAQPAFSSHNQRKARIRRSPPSTVAPTLPGTSQVRKSLYARFR